MSSIKIENRLITSSEFNELRASVNWETIPASIAEKGLRNTTFSALAFLNGNLAGMGRIVGDGFIYFYIQDMIVKPDYHGHGLGRALVENLLHCWESSRHRRGAVMLIAAPGKRGFYEKFNFEKRSEEETSMVLP